MGRRGEHSGSFYPVSTTAIVMCALLCDMIGISKGQLGAIQQDELTALLSPDNRRPVSALVRFLNVPRGGCCFEEMFSYAFVDFHVRFMRQKASYPMCQEILKQATEELERRAAQVGSLLELKDVYCADEQTRALLSSAGAESPVSPALKSARS